MIDNGGKRNTSATPLRIRKLEIASWWLFDLSRWGAGVVAFLAWMGLLIGLLFLVSWLGLCPPKGFLALFGFLLASVVSYRVVKAVVRVISLRVRRWPYWVEIGDRFAYCNKDGVHVLDWSDVKGIEFKHDEWYSDPGEEVYCTSLVATLVTDKKLRMRVASGCAALEYAARIVEALVQGLRNHDSCTRVSSAQGLGRLGPQGVHNLKKAIKHKAECVRKDAAETLQRIEEAVPYLQEATRDKDEAVRKAATDALNSIQPERA